MAGVVTFSMEIELGWGVRRYGHMDKLSDDREAETRALETLLEACERNELPFTFDVVDHLLLDSCRGDHPGRYPEAWFEVDPRSSMTEHPRYYAPDLVATIVDSRVDHEVCSHTFSHVECGEAERETVRSDFDLSREVRADFGLPDNESFVPPRHSMPPPDLLSEFADVVRVPHYEHPGFDRPSRPAKAIEVLVRDHPVVEPVVDDGVVKTYSPEYGTINAPSLPRGQRPTHPVFRSVPPSLRTRLHRRTLRNGVERAAETNSFVHFWCHLYDISNGAQLDMLLPFLDWLGERVADGEVDVEPMKHLKRFV